jgi:glycosyltransferase involved in cell wall biosynthesis
MTNNNILQKLPVPPSGKTKWPWINKSKKETSNGKAWPKISIVTPSYNQGQFIEETIRSVLLQNYPNLEYIIMDGGSTDNSVEIIKKYEPWLTYWVSEKDAGQADAVYRGFEKATGEIIAWINSDDYYLPDAFKQVALAYTSGHSFDFTVGCISFINENGKQTGILKGYSQDFKSLLCFGQYIAQPACFWSRKAFFEVGGFDRNLRFAFDYALFLNLTRKYTPQILDNLLAVYREHHESKTSKIWNDVGLKEVRNLQRLHGIDDIDDDEKNRILNKERLRLLYCQCKSINNILSSPKLLLALTKRSLLYISGR